MPTVSVSGFACNASDIENRNASCYNNVSCITTCQQFCPAGRSHCFDRCTATAAYTAVWAKAECAISNAPQSMVAKPIMEASSPAGLTTFSVSSSTRVVGAMSRITVNMQPNWYIPTGALLTLTGLTDTCPDSAAYFEPPAYCQNTQNPSSASMVLLGASQAVFGGAGVWNSFTGHLVLDV